MSPTPPRTGAVLVAALLLGLLADFVLPGGPGGANLALWAVALAGVSLGFHRFRRATDAGEATAFLFLAAFFGAAVGWRDSEPQTLLALGASASAFAFASFRGGAPWVRGASVFEAGFAIPTAVANSALGGVLLLLGVDRTESEGSAARSGFLRRAIPVLKGVALALPFLLLLGALFASADEFFAEFLESIVRFEPDRLFLIGFFAWITTGYLRRLLGGRPGPEELARIAPWRPSLGLIETATVLILLELLFLAFLLVQLRVLFGGTALIESTPGLGYAEYARQGFFELVAVAAVTLPILLGADRLFRRASPKEERIFLWLARFLLILLGVVMASAFYRLSLYVGEFGLTEDRFYAAALLVWLAFLLVWLGGTLLAGRRTPFAPGVLVSGFVWVLLLLSVNPPARVLALNLDRAAAGAPFDAEYASRIGADAVPLLLDRWEEVPAEARCLLAPRIAAEWGAGSTSDWRSWSWMEGRARAAVREAVPVLEGAISGSECGDG